ncbi:type II toxin-antitoxin system VapC family toxin [Candidatus Curtissbacteria bacterium]|nr:type II toxin-antitoxin system VapC family toxin [Candidatus Curtissbacteria bacterium]
MIVKNVVLDSSVIAKWFLPDETFKSYALKIKEDFVNRKVIVSVPTLIFYEVSNLLKTAIKRLRINKHIAIKAYQGFLDLNFLVHSSVDLFKTSLEKAIDLDISSYDAAYVALAEYLKSPLYTADDNLIKKSKSKLVKSLKDYDN